MSSSLIGCSIHSALCHIETKSFVNYYRRAPNAAGGLYLRCQDDMPNTFAWVMTIHPYIHPVNAMWIFGLLVCQTTLKSTNILQSPVHPVSFSMLLETVPSVPTTIGITVTFICFTAFSVLWQDSCICLSFRFLWVFHTSFNWCFFFFFLV